MNIFFKDIIEGKQISWKELITDLNSFDIYNPYCLSESYYYIFSQIIFSILIGREIILLDSDFTKEELEKLIGKSTFDNDILDVKRIKIQTKEELLEKIKHTKEDWRITLYTSGTTGIPKKVSHSFQAITRFVKLANDKKNDIWGFSYNPTHMAGVQVFFQALLNGNTLIRLFGLDKKQIFREIISNGVTNLSATPTFFRLLLPSDNVCKSVKKITSGGEKFDQKTMNRVQSLFPNAKITNVYASTEAGSLFASDGNVFSVKPKIKDWLKIQKNELFIHQSLIGRTEKLTDEWYATGDLVEIIQNNPLKFKFIARKNEMINVGGYKVNPQEVEEAIRTIEGIKDAYVFSKANSVLGSIVCAEVVTETHIAEVEIRNSLQNKLQEFKIPRLIKFTDKIKTTRTGKSKRN